MKKLSHYTTSDLTATEREMVAHQIEELILLLWPEEIEAPGIADRWLARIEAPGHGYVTSDGVKMPGQAAYWMSATAHQARFTMHTERPRLQLYPLSLLRTEPDEPEEP